MTSSLIYTVLPVGQGTGTLVEVIDTASEIPKAVIIIDLGVTNSKGWIGAQTGEVSAYIAAAELLKMDKPTIDALFLSHPDDDHINMIPDLLGHFDKPGTDPAVNPLVIKKVYFAGLKSEFSVRGKNILTQLAKYAPDEKSNLEEAAQNAGDLQTTVYNASGLEIRLIAGNTVSVRAGGKPVTKAARKDDGYVKNTDSLVLLLSYGSTTKRHFVATADATGLTMAACLRTLKKPPMPWSAPVLSMSLPHHGSLTTAYDLLGKQETGKSVDQTAQDVVNEFVNIFKPESLTVSAGESDAYKHPSPRVIEDFAKHVKEATNGPVQDPLIWPDTPTTPGHFYAAYYALGKFTVATAADAPKADYPARWPSAWGWWPARTTKAIYTVDYFTAASDKDIEKALIPLVQQDAANPANPVEAKFTSKNGPFAKVAWIHSWAYTVSEDGVKVTFGHRSDDSTNFVGNPETLDAEFARFTERPGPLPPELAAPAPAPVLARVVVHGPARPQAGMYRPGRRQVRPLP